MNPAKLYKLSGYLSILAGIIAAMSIYRFSYLYYGLGISVLGFLFAGTNIFLYTRYFYEQEKIPKGYIGMFLSSLPVIFMLILIFRSRN
jgi:hypothetical protein